MKYFIFDLDDTLLNDRREVSDYTLKGIGILKDNNFLIVINTARSYKATKKIYDLINPDYCICNGGASIYDSKSNLICKRTISLNHTNEFLNLIKKSNDVIDFSIQTLEYLYTNNQEYVSRNNQATYNDFHDSLNEEAVKVLIASNDYEKWKKLALKYGYQTERYFNGIWFRISPSNKYKGNLDLYKLLNDENPIDYVFGDDRGDLEMIKNAFCGVLMNNSQFINDEYNISKFSNEEDGVIKYMLYEVLNHEE